MPDNTTSRLIDFRRECFMIDFNCDHHYCAIVTNIIQKEFPYMNTITTGYEV